MWCNVVQDEFGPKINQTSKDETRRIYVNISKDFVFWSNSLSCVLGFLNRFCPREGFRKCNVNVEMCGKYLLTKIPLSGFMPNQSVTTKLKYLGQHVCKEMFCVTQYY